MSSRRLWVRISNCSRMFWPFMDYLLHSKGTKNAPPLFSLLSDRDDDAGTDGLATLTDGEALLLLHGDRRDQLDVHGGVVARHDHLGALRQRALAGHVGGAEVELRTIVVEERRMPPALVLGQNVGFRLELLVRLHRARLAQHLAALDRFLVDAAEKTADVVAGDAFVEQLAEHLDAGHHRLLGVAQTDDLDFLADLDLAALDAAR